MISLEEYKNSLINAYWYKADDTVLKREERKEYLKLRYKDEFLNKIISDTYEFAKLALKEETIKYNYCDFPSENLRINHIGLGLIGGHFADKLFYYEDYIISERIIEYIFGKNMMIEIKEEEVEFETDDENILSFNYYYSLYLQGFPNNIDEIKQELLGKCKILL